MSDENKAIEPKKELELTEGNWKFIKHLREGFKVKEAYIMAGYESRDENAPYQLYHRLKRRIAEIIEADGFDKVRLAQDFEKVLSLPLARDKQEVTLTEWLKLRRLAHTIMSQNDQKASNSAYTVIVIGKDQSVSEKAEKAEVIDVQAVTEDEGKTSS